MPHITEYAPGTPSWVDLGSPDPAAAAAFYGELFGWTIAEGPPEAGGYRMCLVDGQPVAGLGQQMSTEMPPWWTTYVSVADADATAAGIVANGGSLLVPPMDVLDVGRMAVAMDPNGALFSVWQARAHIGAGIVNEPNTFCWNELTTRHKHRSIEFYGTVFGWLPHLHGDGPGDYVEFHLGDRSIAGLMPMVGDMWPAELPDHWMVYFAVDDVDEMAARVTELGGTVAVPPTDIMPGRFTVVNDPQGAVFSMLMFRPEAA